MSHTVKEIDKERELLAGRWKLRDGQFLRDRAILRLAKPRKTTDSIKLVSNEPKVFYDTAMALVSSFPPRFRLPLSINILK